VFYRTLGHHVKRPVWWSFPSPRVKSALRSRPSCISASFSPPSCFQRYTLLLTMTLISPIYLSLPTNNTLQNPKANPCRKEERCRASIRRPWPPKHWRSTQNCHCIMPHNVHKYFKTFCGTIGMCLSPKAGFRLWRKRRWWSMKWWLLAEATFKAWTMTLSHGARNATWCTIS